MKAALTVFVLVAALIVPLTASAQDWVMDWHSTGNSGQSPFTWDITGTSPATLTAVSGGLPPSFSGQAYSLSFSYLGRAFGGLVAQGSFQDPGFSVPAPAPINSFSSDFASGNFDLAGDSFTLHAFIGAGHANAELTATGTRNPVTASAVEPGVMVMVAAGLLAARSIGRRGR
jgi:hypothetical protein